MKLIDKIEDIQKIELEEIKYFDQICKNNNLEYFLAGGSLLGAVRHKGFIPWDDDIDIAMPRNDYEKLLNINFDNKYKILSIENNDEWIFPFAKMIDTNTFLKEKNIKYIKEYGVFIDIFPIDGLGNNSQLAALYERIIRFLRGRLDAIGNENRVSRSFFKKIIQKYYNKKGLKSTYNKILKYAKKHDFNNSKYVGSVVGGAKGKKEIFEHWVYSETIDMEFEGLILKGMKNYDEYLKRMYGDYMELPPENKRGSCHTIECYYRENGD